MKGSDLETLGNEKFVKFGELPQVDIHTPDGLFIKTFVVPKDVIVPQHAHAFDHVTFVCKGRVIAWIDEKLLGEFVEGDAIQIKANHLHEFKALEDSRLACIHNAEKYEFTELNRFEET